MFRSNIKFFLAFFAATMLFAVVQAYAVWQDAPAAPAQYGSSPCPDLDSNPLTYEPCLQADYKPVNLGDATQTKSGSLNILGNVGIGTAGPVEKLEVSGGSSNSILWPLRIDNAYNALASGYGSGIKFKLSSGETGLEGNKWTGIATVAGTDWANRPDMAFYLTNTSASAPTEKLRITGDGNVGIGTTGPLTKLHVVGGDYNSGARIESSDNYGSGIGLKNTSTGGRHFNIFSTGASNGEGAGKLAFQDNAVGTRMIIDSAGNVGIGTTSPGAKLHVNGGISAGDSKFYNSVQLTDSINGTTQSWIWSSAANQLDLGVGAVGSGNTKLTINSSGNVGIGTTNPGAYKLNVVGDANVTRLCIADDCKNSWAAVTSGSGSVTSVTAGAGLFASPNPITTTGTISLNFSSANNWSAVQTFSGGANFPGNGFWNSSGNVGIGTTGPLTKLHVVGGDYNSGARIESSDNYGSGIGLKNTSTGGRHFNIFSTGASNGEGAGKLAFQDNAVGTRMIIDSAGNVGIGTTDPGSYRLNVIGDIYTSGSGTAAGGWYVSSDARLKKNVETLSGALEKLGRARGVSYDLASGQGARQIGVIAQELEQEFPELVKTDDNGYKAVAYDRLSAVLIEAVKELKSQNQILQQRLDLLEKKW